MDFQLYVKCWISFLKNLNLEKQKTSANAYPNSGGIE